MKTIIKLAVLGALALAFAACGDNDVGAPFGGGSAGSDAGAPAPLTYTNPTCGKLCLVKNQSSQLTVMRLDLVVGANALTGYSTGFDLPLDTSKVTLDGFKPGTALPTGTGTIAATAVIPTSGPLANMLVAAQSQKASGDGAVTADTTLAPGSVLFTVELDMVAGATKGVVFDGTASGFVLPSGGLRDRAGNAVADTKDVAIGKLEVTQ